MTVSDWYHEQMPSLINTYLSNEKNPSGSEPVPDATLINDSQKVKFDFSPGKTYFYRIISIAGYGAHYVNFAGHKMKIIEIDGVYTEPQTVETIFIVAGQRYGVLVEARNNTDENFAVSSTMVPRSITVYGDLVYDDDNPAPSKAPPASFSTINDATLIPKDRQPLLGPVDRTITLDSSFKTINGSNRFVGCAANRLVVSC